MRGGQPGVCEAEDHAGQDDGDVRLCMCSANEVGMLSMKKIEDVLRERECYRRAHPLAIDFRDRFIALMGEQADPPIWREFGRLALVAEENLDDDELSFVWESVFADVGWGWAGFVRQMKQYVTNDISKLLKAEE